MNKPKKKQHLFFHIHQVVNGVRLVTGDIVEYHIGVDAKKKGSLMAIDVTLVHRDSPEPVSSIHDDLPAAELAHIDAAARRSSTPLHSSPPMSLAGHPASASASMPSSIVSSPSPPSSLVGATSSLSDHGPRVIHHSRSGSTSWVMPGQPEKSHSANSTSSTVSAGNVSVMSSASTGGSLPNIGNDYVLFGGAFSGSNGASATQQSAHHNNLSPLGATAPQPPPSLLYIRDNAIKQIDSLVMVTNTALTQLEQLRRENALLRAALVRHRIDPDGVLADEPNGGASVLRTANQGPSSILSTGSTQAGQQYSPPSLFSLSKSSGLF